ncbi:MAG: hypothetical protein AAGI88_26090 [Pseudomonadota bacterium]
MNVKLPDVAEAGQRDAALWTDEGEGHIQGGESCHLRETCVRFCGELCSTQRQSD